LPVANCRPAWNANAHEMKWIRKGLTEPEKTSTTRFHLAKEAQTHLVT